MYRKTFLALAVSVAAALPAFAQEPVKIGLITTLSGPGGYIGQDIRDAFKLAVDMEGGKLGGAPVDLMVEDDALKPGQGKQIAERMLTNDGVKLFTGIVFSNVAGATVPDIVDAGAFYISPNAAPSNMAGKGCNENYFVVSWQNDSLHESAGQLASNLGYKSAFVLAPNYQAGKDAITGFKRYFKGKIVGELDHEEDGVLVHACDLDETRFGKATIFDFARHRRVEHYGLITERTGVGAPLGKPEGA